MHFTASGGDRPPRVREISRVTWVGAAANIALITLKAAGGLLAGSTALLADGVHSLSDLATDVAVLVGVRYWSAPADASHPHGHRKIESIITVCIGAALAAIGLGLAWEAVAALSAAFAGGGGAGGAQRLAPAGSPAYWLALAAAALSIVTKEMLYRWTARKGAELGSPALVANACHHRSDAASSVPPLLVLAGDAAGGRMGVSLWFLDPVGTIAVCVMLLQAAWAVAHPELAALLDSSADRRLCSDIRKATLGTRGVIDAHRIRTRVICSNAAAVDLHIVVDRNLSVERGHGIASEVERRILALGPPGGKGTRAVDVVVHVEPGEPRGLPGPPPPGSDTMVDWKSRE